MPEHVANVLAQVSNGRLKFSWSRRPRRYDTLKYCSQGPPAGGQERTPRCMMVVYVAKACVYATGACSGYVQHLQTDREPGEGGEDECALLRKSRMAPTTVHCICPPHIKKHVAG